MIEFKVASSGNNSESGDFWQGLNAASVALQQAAQSETAVYQVFSEQLTKLGLHGSISLLNESGTMLQITAVVFSQRLMRFVRRIEKIVNINSQGFEYPAHASAADSVVLTKGDIVFLSDNSEKIRQVIPSHVFRNFKTILKPFLKLPAILAPIFAKSDVIGILYLAGSNLCAEDAPAIAAFAIHLSIALENARLFQAVQQAESQYRRLFESANDGIFVFDLNSRQILSANPKMMELLGVEADELDSLLPSKWAPPDIYQIYNEHFNKILQQGNHFFEVPFIDQTGRQRHWQISATIIEIDGKPVINGLVRDTTESKQAEGILRQREEQFRVLAENVPGTIYLCKNEQNFPLLYINDGIEDLTGYPKERFLRQEIIYGDLIHPDDQSGFVSFLENSVQNQKKTFHYTYRIQHTSGEWRWAEDVGGGVFDQEGNLLFLEGIVSDITERVQADLLQKVVYHIAAVAHTDISLDELYKSIHEALAPILNVQNFYIALYDEASGMIDFAYFVDRYDSNPGIYKADKGLTGFVIQSNHFQLLTHSQLLSYLKQGEVNVQGTLPRIWLGVPLQLQGKAIGALVVQSYEESSAYSEQDAQFLTFVSEQIANVIERKQAEERRQQLSAELTQQTRLREAILATTPDNFLLCDLNGRFLFISNQILKYLNVSTDTVEGKTWQELEFSAAFGRLFDQDRKSVLQTRSSVTSEFQYVIQEVTREIELITNPVLDDKGEVTLFVTTARDVTEKKQAARAMNRAQKMESLGILAGGIAHDFNNLLVAMMSQTSLAQVHLSANHPAYTHVDKAVKAAEKAASLTRQLLAYSGGGQFTVKPINLNKLIQENIDLLKVAMPKHIILDLALKNQLPLIDADVAQLQQVVMNLLINAAEAIGEQEGTIQIQTAVRHTTAADSIFWRYTGNELPAGLYVSLRVQDSGSGMKNKTISKIFDPFFTTKFTGRGLGLAAVLGIIRSHKGGLHVNSETGKGTTFELLLPLSESLAAAYQVKSTNNNSLVKGVVLVIDDEAAVREAVSDILEMEEIGVLTAANGNEGIAIYKEKGDSIDLVLLDLSMPGISGQDTFAALQKIDENVRILLSSGYSETNAIRGFNSPSLVGFLQKPYRLDVFIKLIQKNL
jgi:two-component system, cell cycle sensor histidine kinase and response regulator CckA